MNYLELLMIVLFFMGLGFLMSIQPIMMVIMMIFITLFYSFFIYKVMGGFWFGYALVLVMLSGVLVVFTYMVSMVPNDIFEFYNLVFIMMFMIMFIENLNFKLFLDLSYISLNLWDYYVGIFNLFLVSFLFAMMVMVVWLSWLGKSSVRVM